MFKFKIVQIVNVWSLSGATTANLPPGVLYRVKATYKYIREDSDELSFDVGDIINVVEYEDPEDQVKTLLSMSSTSFDKFFSSKFSQEEGWLMGSKDGSPEKGIFPANFTKPL